MGLDNINLLGAVAGAVAAMAIGSVWYSPWLFGGRWQALIGKTSEEMGSPAVAMGLASIMFVLMGIGLGWIIPDGAGIGVGLMWGFLAFWAFVLPATVINGAFEGRGWRLAAIYLGYMLVASLVIAAVITFLGG